MSNKIFIPKKKNPKWQPPKTGPGIRQQIDDANASPYDEVKIEDIHKILYQMAAQPTKNIVIRTGPEGLKAFDEAMKKHIGS